MAGPRPPPRFLSVFWHRFPDNERFRGPAWRQTASQRLSALPSLPKIHAARSSRSALFRYKPDLVTILLRLSRLLRLTSKGLPAAGQASRVRPCPCPGPPCFLSVPRAHTPRPLPLRAS